MDSHLCFKFNVDFLDLVLQILDFLFFLEELGHCKLDLFKDLLVIVTIHTVINQNFGWYTDLSFKLSVVYGKS